MIGVLLETAGCRSAGAVYRAMSSVLGEAQGTANALPCRLVVCDDGASDESSQLLQKWAARDARVILVRNEKPTCSPAVCLTKALEGAGAIDSVMWMSPQQVLLPKAIERLGSELHRSPKSDAVFGSVVLQKEQGIFRAGVSTVAALRGGVVPVAQRSVRTGVLIRREALQHTGWLDSNVLMAEPGIDLFRRLVEDFAVRQVHSDVAIDYTAVSASAEQPCMVLPEELSEKYRRLRARGGASLSVENSREVVEELPEGGWSPHERRIVALIFVEHFLRSGQPEKAVAWSKPHWGSESPPMIALRARLAAAEVIARGAKKRADEAEARAVTIESELSRVRQELQNLRSELKCNATSTMELHSKVSARESDVVGLRIELAAIRHRIADIWNQRLKQRPALHRSLKSMATRYMKC